MDGYYIDIGTFITGLKYATGQKAITLWKPSQEFYKTGIDSIGLPKEKLGIIGDSIDSEIGEAQ